MRVFLTGATGFIGTQIIPQLLEAGHKVLGLTRSDAGAKSLTAAGVEAHRGDLEDLQSLRSGAAKADAIIHCGFNHDFSKFLANCEADGHAIEAMASVLVGSKRPLLITSGTGMGTVKPGEPSDEDHFDPNHPNPRKASEIAGQVALKKGVNVSVVRLPQVHDPVKQGLITPYIEICRAKGVVAYVGEGKNRWPAAHVIDAARVYKLAVEKAEPGAHYHAVAEEGVAMREIAEAIAKGMKLPVKSIGPEQVQEHFGWMAGFVGFDMPASSKKTQERLGWHPTGPTLLADLARMDYPAASAH